jgi:hypothetical protein
MNDIELKSCPFCGGKAVLKTSTQYDGQCHYTVKYIECNECYIQTNKRICDGYYGAYCSDEEIAEIWNSRVDE